MCNLFYLRTKAGICSARQDFLSFRPSSDLESFVGLYIRQETRAQCGSVGVSDAAIVYSLWWSVMSILLGMFLFGKEEIN